MSIAQALFSRLIDYAGLFPPASLNMEEAVRNYQRYLAGPWSWMLGNFIVPASRLPEFGEVYKVVCCEEQENPWTVSVACAGESLPVDLQAVQDFPQGAAFVVSLEFKGTQTRTTRAALASLPRGPLRYVEVAPERLPRLLPLLASSGARAKLRTGGLTAGAIPAPKAVAQFLAGCAQERVPFKATAGLHHPMRSAHPLTYEMGSAEALMHGFLNVFLAATLAYSGSTEKAILDTLAEEDPEAFRLGENDNAIAWHDQRITADQIERARREFAISFGSCSFTEPIDDLKALEWL
jgi:hypothetical protein